jgi:hypothetical protein
VAIVLIIPYLLVAGTLFAVNAMKDKWGLALLGAVPILGWFALAGAARLARPNSYWARRWYGPEKRAAAVDRFRPMEEKQLSTMGVAFRAECIACGERFESQDEAIAHVRAIHADSSPNPEAAVRTHFAPGWYPNPDHPETEWYWEGEAWTDSRPVRAQ